MPCLGDQNIVFDLPDREIGEAVGAGLNIDPILPLAKIGDRVLAIALGEDKDITSALSGQGVAPAAALKRIPSP